MEVSGKLMRNFFVAMSVLGQICTAALAQTSSAPPVAATAIPPKYPVTHFAAYGKYLDPILSPDGRSVAYRVYRGGKWLLLVHQLFQKEGNSNLFGVGEGDLNWVQWAGNDRLVFGVGSLRNFGESELYFTRPYVLDVATKASRLIGHIKGSFDGDDIIYIAPDGSYVLHSTAHSVTDWPEVNKVDLTTNKIERIQRQRLGIYTWNADEDGVLRSGTGVDDAGNLKIIYRSSASDDFKPIPRITSKSDDNQYEQFWFAIGSDIGYIQTSSQTGRSAIYKYDWKNQTILEPVFANDLVDVDTMWVSHKTGLPVAGFYTDDRYHIKWFDPEKQAFQQQLEESVGNKYAFVVDRARDTEAKVIWVGSASSPGSYYYFNSESGTLRRIAEIAPTLKDAKLAAVEHVRFKARDGLEIPAYITWPVGRARENLPMIMMPHGGPHARDA
jgi:dipeptidyl aminopeptidase/acylaminoacyl peptidase